MGFINKIWTDPVTLDASNINRLEQGIKNSHDNLGILNEEIANLQAKRINIEAEISKLIKQGSDLTRELTNIVSSNTSTPSIPSNNYLSTLEQILTQDELNQVYSNLKLNNFLKLTDVKINGTSIVTGSILDIAVPIIDQKFNANSPNAISNKAVAEILASFNPKVEVPTKLSELTQDENHMTVTATEKAKWNKGGGGISKEVDPTVPAWAKEPNKPFYAYSEIIGTPTKLSVFTNDMDFTTNAYVDSEITKLKNILLGPDGDAALDTITELASAIAGNSDIIDVLNQAITTKANSTDVNASFKEVNDLLETKADTTELSSVTNATLSSDSKTLTVTKRDGTSFDFQGGSDLSNYVTKDGFTMRASSTAGKFYYNTGAGEKSISVKMPTIPVTSVNGLTGDVVIDTSGFVPNTRTVNGKALSSDISLGNKDVGALPDYTITISHQSAGNPRMIKFASVNYSSRATCFKMAAMTCHDNGASYQFLTDMLIAVTTAGEVTANIYKFAQSSVGNVDGVARYTGDVFYVNDTTNKIVDFYILCGQWSESQFTPVTKVGSTTIDYVTQHSGNANEKSLYYSNGDKTWVNGCGTTYAKLSDLSNYVTTNTAQTISGKKIFTGTVDIRSTASTMPLRTRGIVGSDGAEALGDLYLQYNTTYAVYFGSTGQSRLLNNGGIYLTGWTINKDSTGNLVFTYS